MRIGTRKKDYSLFFANRMQTNKYKKIEIKVKDELGLSAQGALKFVLLLSSGICIIYYDFGLTDKYVITIRILCGSILLGISMKYIDSVIGEIVLPVTNVEINSSSG